MVAPGGLSPTQQTQSALPPVHEAWLPREHPLHRPRHGGKQRFTLACAAVFFCAPLLALLLGVRPPEIENHPLAGFPGPGDGWGMLTGMSQWATDHLPFRDAAVSAADGMSRGVFGEPPPFARVDSPQPQTPVGPIAPPVQQPQEKRQAPVAGFTSVIEGKDNWLYFGDEIRWKCGPSQSMDEVMAQLRRLREGVEASGRYLVITIAPDKSTVVPEKLPDQYAGQQCASAMRGKFWDRVTAEAGAVDLRGALRIEAGRLGHQPYFPQDTHWTHEGGVVLTRQLAESVSPGVSRSWRITPSGTWHGKADLPPLIGRSAELTGQDYSLAPDGANDRTNRTPSDFRTPLHMTSAPATGTVGAKVAMLADSYAEFASPFLGAAFNDITIFHTEDARRNMPLAGQLLKDSEIVVIEVVERHLATGLSPITDPVFVDEMRRVLASSPR